MIFVTYNTLAYDMSDILILVLYLFYIRCLLQTLYMLSHYVKLYGPNDDPENYDVNNIQHVRYTFHFVLLCTALENIKYNTSIIIYYKHWEFKKIRWRGKSKKKHDSTRKGSWNFFSKTISYLEIILAVFCVAQFVYTLR